MHLSARTAASSVLGFTVAAGLAMGIAVPSPQGPLRAWDDISDYDGTKCATDQIYDAAQGQCVADMATNDPQEWGDISDYDGTKCNTEQIYDAGDGQCAAGVVTNDSQAPVDLDDPGALCAETQIYDVPDGKCVSGVDTNDDQAVVTPEGEDPTKYTAPKPTDIPNCATTSDPLSMCS